MKSRWIKWIGLGVLLLTLLGVIAAYRQKAGAMPQVSLRGYLGGEKIGIFEDEEIARLLRTRYGITFDYQKAGSYDMMSASHENIDYLFPASQGALEHYKTLHQRTPKNEIIYNTPIVIYSRPLAVDALIRAGIVSVQGDVHYLDMEKLADALLKETSWSELGVPELYGSLMVDTTDPSASNSGNMFAALLANTLNGGATVTMRDVERIAPKLRGIYDKLGYMETSSADMFNQFLRTGVGAYPLIAGYENQLLEFASDNAQLWEPMKEEILLLYPVPTVWSTHVYIALTPQAESGISALLDPEIQRLSWTRHGFRTGAAASEETGQFPVSGIAPHITSVTQLPPDEVMSELIKRLK